MVNVCLDRCNSVECANGQLGYGKRRRRRRSVSESGEEAEQLKEKLYEVSMSTIIRYEEDSVPFPDRTAADAVAQAEVLPQQVPSARQRQQELLVERAVLSSEFKRDGNFALEELAEAFGTSGSSSSGYQRQTYVEFELDEEDRRNSATACFFGNRLIFVILQLVALKFLV